MSLRSLRLCFGLLAACAETADGARDAAQVDAGDAGTELDDAGWDDGGHDAATHDAAARSGWGGLMANNPPECPKSPPLANTPCTGTTSCKYSGDCAFEGVPRSATFSAKCADGKWSTESPDFCRSVPSREPRYDEADGGSM